jgi:hypothetical protein
LKQGARKSACGMSGHIEEGRGEGKGRLSGNEAQPKTIEAIRGEPTERLRVALRSLCCLYRRPVPFQKLAFSSTGEKVCRHLDAAPDQA